MPVHTPDAPKHDNRLAQETSPYLLQHRHNPVDWFPWGEEAFQRAREEDRPILLSVGYSACHWCHVMERESFENPDIAVLMNQWFVCVKVDREERPDVGAIYMAAVQMLTGQGGWPMTVFLTPEGKPFYGGTYYPPDDMFGRPGFPRVLAAVAEAWRERKAEVLRQADTLTAQLDEGNELVLGMGGGDALLTPSVLNKAYAKLAQGFDPLHGGFGVAPKFPQPSNLDFLLRFHARTKQAAPLQMVEKTLQRMALGGMYDQLGGGFHRYSTDREWLAPHFEKMLYDNAQLAQTYARAWQLTGKAFYRGVAEETLEYVLREMTHPDGGFYSAQDADSEGEEGKFFVWTPDEVKAVLGERDAALFGAFYDVTPGGNWEGMSILRVVKDANEVAAQFGLSVEEAAEILDGARVEMLAAREARIKPGLDDKVLTAWNGLMLAAFAECGAIFGRADFVAAAERNAAFILGTLRTEGGRLLRTWRNGEAKLNGYLEDYAFTADGLLHLYQATFDARWLSTARSLADAMLAHFWDGRGGGFFATSDDHEKLIQRLKDVDDNATPSGNSVAVEVLLKLAAYTGDQGYAQRAAKALRQLAPVMEQHPYGFTRLLGALDLYLDGPLEIGIVGDPDDADTQALTRAAFTPYLPNKVIGFARPTVDMDRAFPVEFLKDRPARDGRPTAYVCRNFACKEPVTTSDALRAQLT